MHTSKHPPLPRPTTNPDTLTGSTAATWKALTTNPGATATTIANITGFSHPATRKALIILEQHHLATRQPGTSSSTGRNPDHWHPNPTALPTPPTHHNTNPEPSQAISDPTTDTSTTPDQPPANTETLESAQRAKHAPGHHASADQPTASELPPDDRSSDRRTEPPRTTDPASSSPPADTPNPAATTAKPSTTVTIHRVTSPPATATTGKSRLAPGALRQMVIDHLQAHPTSAFTATGISRAIDRSSGAIANALVILTKQGRIEVVTEKPRTYKIASPAAPQP